MVFHDSIIIGVEASQDGVMISSSKRTYKGDCLVLATGARTGLARQLGFGFKKHGGIGMRMYAPNGIDLKTCIVWRNERLSPGYGWIFPVPRNQLNVGIGYHESYKPQESLNELMEAFLETLSAQGIWIKLSSRPRGWMLRVGLKGESMSKERVILAGENAYTTYDFTGEGIGKALQSGIIAGETIANADGDYSRGRLSMYDKRILDEFSSLHKCYERATKFMHIGFFNFLITNILAHSKNARRIFEEVLEGRKRPEELWSIRGVVKNMIPRK
jgi:flavin-dependent dehydrogenase